MKSYLKRVLEAEPGKTHLVIIDATDPEDAIAESATMEAVFARSTRRKAGTAC